MVQKHIKSIDTKIADNFGGKRNTSRSLKEYSLSQTTITVLSEKVGYEALAEHIEPKLLETVKERSIKKKTSYNSDLSFALENAQQNLQESLLDRKIIVKNFVMSRF